MKMTLNLIDRYCKDCIRVNQLIVGWTLKEGEIDTHRKAAQQDEWHKKNGRSGSARGSLLLVNEVVRNVASLLSSKSALLKSV